MKVYEGNWTAQTRDHLIRRIKTMQKEINRDIVIKMFDNLKGQVHVANQKWATKPYEILKLNILDVCNRILSEN